MGETPGGSDKPENTADALKSADVERETEDNTERQPEDVESGKRPPIPPPIDTGSDGNGCGGEDHGPQHRPGPKWTDVMQAVCAGLLVLITLLYTSYTAGQTQASIKAANAAKSAADTAAAQLAEQKRDTASSDRRLQAQINVEATSAAASKAFAQAAESSAKTAFDTLAQQRISEANSERQFSTQLKKLEASIQAANRLAIATEKGLDTSRQALAQNQQDFADEQRPYVFTSITTLSTNASHDGFIGYLIYTNSGKSPALDISLIEANVVNVNGAGEQAEKELGRLKFPKMANRLGQVLGPSQSSTLLATAYPINVGPMSPQEVDYLASRDDVIAIIGILRYRDITGRRYHSNFCQVRRPNGTMVFCGRGNTAT